MLIKQLAPKILGLPRYAKKAIAIFLDTLLCILTVWIAYYLRLGYWLALKDLPFEPVLISLCLAIPIFIFFGMYRTIFRYGGRNTVKATLKAIIPYACIYVGIITFIGIDGVPRTVGIIQPTLLFLLITLSRGFAKVLLSNTLNTSSNKKLLRSRILIYGAGSAGRQFSDAVRASSQVKVMGYLDDDVSLQGGILNGLIVYAPKELDVLINSLDITEVLLAIPSAGRSRRNEILENFSDKKINIRTLPDLNNLVEGKISVSDMLELDIDDLLGRPSIKPDVDLLKKNISSEVILVTGAGGSIGGELCRQIVQFKPKVLLLVEQSEFALYQIHQELEQLIKNYSIELIPLLASVQNESRMREIIENWMPSMIYHAAAYKHVPLVEHNPIEGVRNNVFGTLILAQLALEFGVGKFTLISTDKAVRPTNIMGASKRLAEMILQAISQAKNSSKTCFSMVRFGNVLGSSGSVVPLFREQIRLGGPVTITDVDVTRYFMTITEASQLVLQSSAMAVGGDVFLLDMGEPIKIIDLATRMITLSGFSVKDDQNPDGDIAISVSGLRPGEKLYEELLIGGRSEPTSHPRIMKSHEEFLNWDLLEGHLNSLEYIIEINDFPALVNFLQNFVKGYQPNSKIVDWVYLRSKSN